MGVTAPLTKKELRAQRLEAQVEKQRQEIQAGAHRALLKARAHIHTKMNRQRRRKAAKAAGIFKYEGLWAGIHNMDERKQLTDKTFVRAAAGIGQVIEHA